MARRYWACAYVAAMARRRYPDRKAVKDNEAFKQFMSCSFTVRLNVEFRRDLRSIEQIFYKWLRCELVHEGGLPVDIQFMPCTDLVVRAGGTLEFVLKLSEGWFDHLCNAVIRAPENRGAFML